MIAAWIGLAVGLLAVSHVAGSQTSHNLTLPGTGSTKAQDLLQDKLPSQANGTNPIVLQAKSGKLTDSKNKTAVDNTVKSLQEQPGVTRVISPLSKEGASTLSKDKTIGCLTVTLKESKSDLTEDDANKIIDATQPASSAGLEVATGGYLGQAVSKTDTESSEAVGLAAAVVTLLFAFGTATAMALPLVTAIIGLASAARPAEEAGELAGHRPAPHRPGELDQEDARRQVRLAGDGRQAHGRRLHRHPHDRPVGQEDRVNHLRDTVIPKARTRRSTSAARPRATSTWRLGSPTSCRG